MEEMEEREVRPPDPVVTKQLIDDAEYVLATYYEYGHARNDALKEGDKEIKKEVVEKEECMQELHESSCEKD